MITPSVGTQLRNSRHAKQLSLGDLEALTGIRSSYLLVMEMDQFSLLPSKSFEISYIKKYAQAVDLDYETVLRDYHMAVAEKNKRIETQQPQRSEEPSSYSRAQLVATSHREKSPQQRKILPLLLSFLIGFSALIVLIVLFWSLRPTQSKSSPETTFHTTSQSPDTEPSSTEPSPTLTVTPSVDGLNLAANLSDASEPVEILLTLPSEVSETWFSVSNSDYESGAFLTQASPTTSVILPEDTAETVITLGNTSGAHLTVNGQDIDLSTLAPTSVGYIILTIE